MYVFFSQERTSHSDSQRCLEYGPDDILQKWAVSQASGVASEDEVYKTQIKSFHGVLDG